MLYLEMLVLQNNSPNAHKSSACNANASQRHRSHDAHHDLTPRGRIAKKITIYAEHRIHDGGTGVHRTLSIA